MNYDKLREKIIIAVPEIMELKFGCDIGVGKLIRIDHPFAMNTFVTYLDKDDKVNQYETSSVYPRNNGRPIRLADIIIALGDKFKGDYDKQGNYLFFLDPEADEYRILWGWNLEENDLSNQSDETKQDLYDLLVKH